MHNSLPTLILIASLVGLLTFGTMTAYRTTVPEKETTSTVYVSQENDTEVELPRESITFILGEDEETSNFYYTKALRYFRQNESARTEYLESDCRSLKELRDHLEANTPHNGEPWGRINVVVHSNAWSNLSVPVLPEGKRANTAALLAAMDEGLFTELPDKIIDSKSEMVLHGCGLGNDEGFLETISLAFGGEEDQERPSVHSPKFFVTYDVKEFGGSSSEAKKYYSRPHYAFYKTGYHPGNHELAKQFNRTYPNNAIQWTSALAREQPRFLGDSYTHNFRIPIVYIVTYPDKSSRPGLKSEEEKLQWVSDELSLQDKIAEIGIPGDFFKWTVQRIPYKTENGITVSAIKAIGLCQVACVLQAITEEDPQLPGTKRPVQPLLSNQEYFGSASH